METTRLSSKGQIIIPKAIRQAYKWPVGQEFLVEQTEQGILLRPKSPSLKHVWTMWLAVFHTRDGRRHWKI